MSFMQSTKAKKPSIDKSKAQKILGSVPYEHGFHFFSGVGKYTGETAVNLFSFYEELKTIELASVKFHFPRGDFQSWISNTLGDDELAEGIVKIKVDLASEDLRKDLLRLVLTRLQELQAVLKTP
jgi:hypothetical protein